jgi:pimeloyl-ACP methyl ester carboxylesterase
MKHHYIKCTSNSDGSAHRLHVTEWGSHDNPDVVICAHGLTRCGRDFDRLAQALQDRFRVICPDVAGRGESQWLSNKADYNYVQYVSDMVRLIAHTHAKRVRWVGTSMGGIIGMLLASDAHSRIERLVVNDVGPFIPKASLERISQYVGREPPFHSIAEAVAAARAVSPFGPLTDDEWLVLTLPLLKQTPDGSWRFRYDPAIGDSFRGAPIADVDLSAYWNKITCRTLVTRGVHSDLLLPHTYAEMLAKPNVKGVEFADTGHAPMFQHANTIQAVREFLLAE